MPGPSRYNRKLKRKNDRRSARASRGGRTRSEAGLARSTAASGRRVSRTNRAAGRPIRSLPKSGRSPVRIDRAKRRKPSYGSMTLSELSAQRKVPRKYRTAAKSASTRSLSPAKQRASRVVGEDGRDLTAIQKIGQAAEIASLAPVGGGVGLATRGLILGAGRVAPRAVRVGKVASKAAKNPGKASTRVKQAVKKAPGRTKRKVKAKGKKAKRQVKQLKTKKGAARAAKGAAKAPVRVARKNPALATGAYAVAADKTGASNPVVKQLATDVRGIADAVDSPSDVVKTGKTTGRAALGALAGAGALIGAGAITAGRAGLAGVDAATGGLSNTAYSGEQIASPASETAKASIEGTKAMLKPFVEGDTEDVKRVVQDELGFLPVVLSPKVISATRNSRLAQKARQGVRDRAQVKRTRKNEKIEKDNEQRVKQRRRKRETKEGKPYFKQSLPDTRYGGEYAMPRVGRVIEGFRQPRQIANRTARAKGLTDRQTQEVLGSIAPFVRKIAVPKGRKAKDFRNNALDAIPSILTYGIPRNHAQAVKWMNDIENGLEMPDNPPRASDQSNFEFLRNNPQLFKDKNFWKARDILFREQDKITTSEVKRYIAAGGALGIKNPDERLAEGVELGDGTVVKAPRGRAEDPKVQRQLAELKNLRAKIRAAEKRGDGETVAELSPRMEKLENKFRLQQRAFRKASNEFVSETQAAMAKRGLETPAYVRSTKTSPDIGQAIDFPESGQLSQRAWIDRDKVRRAGEAERSWDSFVRSSIYAPRAQRVYHELVSEFVASNAVRLPSARGNSVFLTRAEINKALERGEINADDFAVFHSQHFRAAVQDPSKINPDTGVGAFFQLDDAGRTALTKLDQEIRDRAADPGNKYVVVPKPAVTELTRQFTGPDKWSKAANINRLGSRIVLGYNPSWAVAQFAAEGIPAAIAIGANPLRLRRVRKMLKEIDSGPPEPRARVDALAGQTAGTTNIPGARSVRVRELGRRDRGLDTRGIDLDTRNPITAGGRTGQFFSDLARGEALGKLDRYKGGKFRRLVVAAQADRELNGMFRGLGKYMKLDDQIQRKMDGMTDAQKLDYLVRNPKTAAALEGYLDDVMGNWRAITSRERPIAALTAFYPFVRYAFKTAFWGFPKRHPIKTAILYTLAQVNAEQLEKFVDNGTPLDWLNYAFPVISMDGKKKTGPTATRIAPALNVVVEAIGTDNLARLFGGLSPIVGVGVRGIQGDDWTGQDIATGIEDNILLALSGLAAMFAPYRIASEELNPERETIGNLKDLADDPLSINLKGLLGGFTPRKTGAQKSEIGRRGETSKRLARIGTNRGLPALFNPFQLQDSEDFRETREIIQALNEGRFSDLPGSAAKKARRSSSSGGSTSLRDAFLGGSTSSGSSSSKGKTSLREAFLGK